MQPSMRDYADDASAPSIHIWFSGIARALAFKDILNHLHGIKSRASIDNPIYDYEHEDPVLVPPPKPDDAALLYTVNEGEEKDIIKKLLEISNLIERTPALKNQYAQAMEIANCQFGWEYGDNVAIEAWPRLKMETSPPRVVLAMENVSPQFADTLAEAIGLGWRDRQRLPPTIRDAGHNAGNYETGGKNLEIPMDHPNLAKVREHISMYLEKIKPKRNAWQKGERPGGNSLG